MLILQLSVESKPLSPSSGIYNAVRTEPSCILQHIPLNEVSVLINTDNASKEAQCASNWVYVAITIRVTNVFGIDDR